jgi:hypothetical protein
VADREVQAVEAAEHTPERLCGAGVDDQLAAVRAPVPTPVLDGQQPQAAEPDGAALVPEATLLELRLDRRGQRLGRRVERREGEQDGGEREQAVHARTR